ncbi:host specificity factor TipJ family phage tail protein [Stenotrophomonas sp.]|uniref:host specificity factor TipJ family phage tail protein n=1 Tax=Stenotrophomonas sp. TaxID=69392 RepID=UPI0028A79678|nr:host specificity factor TipJ family phage tail protein [Stenotrophomonas sp.]
MGLMELPRTEPGQLIVTPHPMLLDGQRTVVWEARAGESLYALLMRNVPELDGQPWAVSIGGVVVERHLWHCVYPKQGQVVEVRGGVGKTALMVVAMIALTYFTMGAGAGWISGAFGVAAGGMGATLIGAGLFIAGSMLVNKVLGPKPAKMGSQSQDSVYSLSGARNQLRQYEPLPMLFGKVRITPDLLSKPYTWYEGNDQYLGLQLCAGINVGRVEEIYNGDTLLSSYEGAKVYHAGYSQMPDQAIPLYSNADVIDGGQLLDTSSDPKHTPSAWIERTSSADTVRLVVGLEYQLYDKTSKGKDKNNTERVEVQYRPTSGGDWQYFGSYTLNSSKTKAYRAGFGRDVARGQYDVRVRTAGLNTNGSGAQAAFTWTTLTSVQVDEGDYTGISRTGLELKATGQLNGTPDELRAIGYADPIPVWGGSAWTTEETSNPGAQILAYARGIRRGGRLLGGMALDEDQIDVESLKAFTLHCAANGYAYNFHIKDARNHEQVLSAIALAGFGQITWAGGRLGVVWAAQDQPLSGVVNMGTIKKGQFQVDYSLSNAADGIEYTYIDEATWETKTLRVPAPGVTTMLNPAQVTGEGVTTEEHAARMARWHLAQSLYQYKDISYSTDIEHLSYQRLSVLAMQHDMTQWGYGGRVVAAADSAGTVTLRLDEPVPAPPSGVGYIGLRIPGERVYRVLKVKPFTGESDTIELLDAWPSDAAVPGATPNNPAHDTLWIYDFKQTPGLRVRVVSVEPESDLKGASVRVVQEGAEFWNYVLTGDYVPSPSGSLLQTRPVASNLRVTEQQVVQGNTTFTELTATFDVSGPVSNVVVRAAVDGQELEEVAQTQTRMATWRIPSAGAYNIVVRPFSPDGEPGVAVSAAYVTAGAELPPKLVDLFDVEQRSGGVRIYTWGWLAETIQSPDFAGVEIRYTAGSVSSPVWEDMTPVGDTGYHTAPFEVVVPEAGTWTFSCRSRNTAGVLSTVARVVTRTLQANLGEQIGGIGQDLDDLTRQQVAQQQALEDEQESRLRGDLQTAAAAAADASAKANAARDAAIAHADVIGAQVADILDADEWVATKAYPKGDLVKRSGKLYRALRANTNKAPESNAADWQFMGNYTSLGEAVAASISIGTQNATDIAAQATQLTSVTARMPTGVGPLATAASVSDEVSARAAGDAALGTRTSAIEARMPSGTDKLANEARVVTAESASASRDTALGNRTTVIEARLPSGSGALATAASVTDEATARTSGDSALASRTSVIEARLPNGTDKLANEARVVAAESTAATATGSLATQLNQVKATADGASATVTNVMQVQAGSGAVQVINPGFEGDTGWGATTSGENLPTNVYYVTVRQRSGARALRFDTNATVFNAGRTPTKNAERFNLRGYFRAAATNPNAGATVSVGVRWYDGAGAYISGGNLSASNITPGGNFTYADRGLQAVVSAPETAATVQVYLVVSGLTTGGVIVDDVTLERLSETEVSARAANTIALDVGGNISGTVNENDGTRSSFSILASIFRVISGASTGLEWQNGYLRAYSSAIQLVLGINFGASSNLCFWYGPNVGAASCTKSNGTIWFDNSGSAYFGGSLSAGILKNSSQTTVLTANPTISVGPFTTNGKSKTVTVGYSAVGPELISYYPGRNESSGPPPVPANDSPATSLALSRRYAGGSLAVISSTSISHSTWLLNSTYIPKDALDPNLPNGGWQQRYYFISSASITYTDTLVGTENFEYTATAGSGSFQRIQQNLSVTSVENP